MERRETDDGRSGFVRSGPDRVHHRPHHIRQAAADHPESAVVGEGDFLRSRARVCVVVGVLCVVVTCDAFTPANMKKSEHLGVKLLPMDSDCD